MSNNFFVVCSNNVSSEHCGTFVEIHRPASPNSIFSLHITSSDFNAYKSMLLSGEDLCTGQYEVKF